MKKKKKSRSQNQSKSPGLNTNGNEVHTTDGGVCRDFLRNVCTRENCKYQHVIPAVEFCHDFQNTRACARKHCKFTHGTYEDEQYYLTSGKLPEHLKPVCLNFLKNQCTRDKCKFLHPSRGESNERTLSNNSGDREEIQCNEPSRHNVLCLGEEPKRSKNVNMADMMEIQQLSQENEFLKTKLHELQGHISELRSNNEFLMEENYRLKQEKHNSNLATIAVPSQSASVTALAVSHPTSMALAVPHSASVTALTVPHSSSMALAVPHSASVTALAVPHSSSMALAVPHS
ncbi:zinc finger CCCH domain-containing protein 10-like, partial [Diaphorina citri]